MYEKYCILIRILLNFISKGSVNKMSALFHIMAMRWTGDKPSYELSDEGLVYWRIYESLGLDELNVHFGVVMWGLPHGKRSTVTITSYDRYGVSNHRQVVCLFSHLFGLSSKKTSRPTLSPESPCVESRELQIYGKINILNMPTKFWSVITSNTPFLKIIIICKLSPYLHNLCIWLNFQLVI